MDEEIKKVVTGPYVVVDGPNENKPYDLPRDPDKEILEELREEDEKNPQLLAMKKMIEYQKMKIRHHAHQIKMKQDQTRKINRKRNKSAKKMRKFNKINS